jgi:hypothetical protein
VKSPGRRSPITTATSIAGLAWGTALLASPERVVRAIAGATPPDRALLVGARVLGARHIGQSVAVLFRPELAARWGVGIDVVHALSMLCLAGVDGRRRRPALASAAVSAALGIGSLACYPRLNDRRGSARLRQVQLW